MIRDYLLVNGDLTKADADCIIHQVNCMGVMGSGVAKAIKDAFPVVYDMYFGYWYLNRTLNNLEYRTDESIRSLLGNTQVVPLVTETRCCKPYLCINMFTQGRYGYGGVHTDMVALKNALTQINHTCRGLTVAFPWMVGCVRGGGNWDEVLPLILTTLTDVKEIKFYRM